jgi:hypothetical protein
MTEYRLYRRDGSGRILAAPEVIIAASDEEAVARVRALLAMPCEVWQESRLVAVVATTERASS